MGGKDRASEAQGQGGRTRLSNSRSEENLGGKPRYVTEWAKGCDVVCDVNVPMAPIRSSQCTVVKVSVKLARLLLGVGQRAESCRQVSLGLEQGQHAGFASAGPGDSSASRPHLKGSVVRTERFNI